MLISFQKKIITFMSIKEDTYKYIDYLFLMNLREEI